MEKKRASERLRKTKWRKNTLLSDSERPNGEKTRFWVTQKDQMEKKHASERLRKAKWRKNTLLSDSERPNGEKTCFWVTQKDQMKKKHASERLRKAKWRKNTFLSDSERLKRRGERSSKADEPFSSLFKSIVSAYYQSCKRSLSGKYILSPFFTFHAL